MPILRCHLCINAIFCQDRLGTNIGKALKKDYVRFFSGGPLDHDFDEANGGWTVPGNANCIIIDHVSAFEPGLVAPFLYAA
jgi:hypothetical protein